MPNRDLTDNVYRPLELIYFGRTKPDCPFIVLSLDIEKAFDWIEHDFLLALLKFMDFGPEFLTAIQAIYMLSLAAVWVNGQLSMPFSISRGTPQDCPLSPLLFVLAIEPLAAALRSSEQYCGILVGNHVHKLSMFADDIALYMTNPTQSLRCIEAILEPFHEVSGLNVNKDKPVIYPIVMDNTLRVYIINFLTR